MATVSKFDSRLNAQFKTLKVFQNGEYQEYDPAGDNDVSVTIKTPYIVNTATATFADVAYAIEQGEVVVAEYEVSSYIYYLPLVRASATNFRFSGFDSFGHQITASLANTNTWTTSQHLNESFVLTTGCAPQFINGPQYLEGDIVSYDNKVWKFTTDYQGAWDVSKVTQTSLLKNMPYIVNGFTPYSTMVSALHDGRFLIYDDGDSYYTLVTDDSDLPNSPDIKFRQIQTSRVAQITITPNDTRARTYYYWARDRALAPLYNANNTYALDALVVYNGLLYKCTTAITVPEEWNSSHWTQTYLVDLL